ncbi:protein phosphatase 1 regulatory inhibitor subunit 16B [Protopterus annectens]|uniref:protein phosphatase 1 regulatory inhibitor subunit 16B n=1 Tax=Protopterus annectens TaxID=7888 RepID=UPI001CFC284B|nr:protein phosphatase 1 regulatory inhibitor subunit 16B [Protopterus annectens]
MANHVDLLAELQLLEKVPTVERLRAAQKRRAQQLKKWAQYEKEMQSKKRRNDKKKNTSSQKRVSFAANITLLEASARGDIEEVRFLLRNKINPDLCNEDGLTAVHQCCIDNYISIAKLLLNNGANVNAKDNELWTPLHAAATCGHQNMVRILIQHGADLLAVNADGNMPYDLCDDDPTLDIIETEMANRGVTQDKINEMRAATEQQMIADMGILMETKHDLNVIDAQGATLLHIAAANGYTQAAELLLEHGIRVDSKDCDGWEPLHAATCWGQMQVAELLVSHGASLTAKTHLDETPIDLCEDEEMKTILVDLKHKHDTIMRSQLKHKSSLNRRTSSAGSRGKVVRRASLCDRTNMYKKEHEKEAIVWQQLAKEDETEAQSSDGEEKESNSDQENKDPNRDTTTEKNGHQLFAAESMGNNKDNISDACRDVPKTLMNTTNHTAANGDILKSRTSPNSNLQITVSPTIQDVKHQWSNCQDRSHQTLSELKKQRAAAKLMNYPLLSAQLSNGIGHLPESSSESKTQHSYLSTLPHTSNGTPICYTETSGDPPILKLKAPIDEPEEKVLGCCRIS